MLASVISKPVQVGVCTTIKHGGRRAADAGLGESFPGPVSRLTALEGKTIRDFLDSGARIDRCQARFRIFLAVSGAQQALDPGILPAPRAPEGFFKRRLAAHGLRTGEYLPKRSIACDES
jgi:hypothetical protein